MKEVLKKKTSLFKRIIASVLTMAMMVSMSSMSGVVFAEDVEGATPRAPICSDCMVGRVFQTTEYGDWSVTKIELSCSHGFPKGEDWHERRDIFTVHTCDSCGSSAKIKKATESKENCYGYN